MLRKYLDLKIEGPQKIFGSKREEVSRGWRRLHNEELHNLYTSSDILGSSSRGG
jgi:hypothetical protein